MNRNLALAMRLGRIVELAAALFFITQPATTHAAEFTGAGTHHIPPDIVPTLVVRENAGDSLTGAILRGEPSTAMAARSGFSPSSHHRLRLRAESMLR
jgi:hypothetical protein